MYLCKYVKYKIKGLLKNLRSLKVWSYKIIYQYSENDKTIFIKFNKTTILC